MAGFAAVFESAFATVVAGFFFAAVSDERATRGRGAALGTLLLRRHPHRALVGRVARRRIDDDAVALVQLRVVREPVDAREIAGRQAVAPPELHQRVAALRRVIEPLLPAARGLELQELLGAQRHHPHLGGIQQQDAGGVEVPAHEDLQHHLRVQLRARVDVVPLAQLLAADAERVGDLVEAVAVAGPVEHPLASLVAERTVGDRDQDGVVVGARRRLRRDVARVVVVLAAVALVLVGPVSPRRGTTIAVPARSSAESFTPFRRRSSRTAMPRARATSSSVSPKRSCTVSSLSAARALSMFAA